MKFDVFKMLVSIALLAALISAAAGADSLTDDLAGVTVIEGVAVTGLNRLLGEPVWALGQFGTLGFEWVFAYDPDGNDSLQITAATPLDAVMASGIDLLYISFFGLSPEDIDPALVNVPLHRMPVISSFSGERQELPLSSEVSVGTRSRLMLPEPITLEQWLMANGSASIFCREDGTSEVRLRMRELIPNGLYYIVGLMQLANGSLDAVPFGGVPSLFVADRRGRAQFDRSLSFCPTDTFDGDRLFFIQIEYHSDAASYGAAPHQAQAASPTPTGITSHAHLTFPVEAEPLI